MFPKRDLDVRHVFNHASGIAAAAALDSHSTAPTQASASPSVTVPSGSLVVALLGPPRKFVRDGGRISRPCDAQGVAEHPQANSAGLHTPPGEEAVGAERGRQRRDECRDVRCRVEVHRQESGQQRRTGHDQEADYGPKSNGPDRVPREHETCPGPQAECPGLQHQLEPERIGPDENRQYPCHNDEGRDPYDHPRRITGLRQVSEVGARLLGQERGESPTQELLAPSRVLRRRPCLHEPHDEGDEDHCRNHAGHRAAGEPPEPGTPWG